MPRNFNEINQACPPVLSRLIKETENGEKEREEIYLMWLHLGKETKRKTGYIPLTIPSLGSWQKFFCLKVRQEIWIMKQFQSRRGLVHHPCLLTWWSDKLSELNKIHFRKRRSPFGNTRLLLFPPSPWDSRRNSSSLETIVSTVSLPKGRHKSSLLPWWL